MIVKDIKKIYLSVALEVKFYFCHKKNLPFGSFGSQGLLLSSEQTFFMSNAHPILILPL